jgi:hypothetical protein
LRFLPYEVWDMSPTTKSLNEDLRGVTTGWLAAKGVEGPSPDMFHAGVTSWAGRGLKLRAASHVYTPDATRGMERDFQRTTSPERALKGTAESILEANQISLLSVPRHVGELVPSGGAERRRAWPPWPRPASSG